MNYDDFVLKCIELAPSECRELKYDDSRHEWVRYRRYGVPKSTKNDFFLEVSYSTGGMSGGSCWGSEATPYTSSDPPVDFKELDDILAHFKPEMSYLEYRRLINELVEFSSYTEYEYYGNHTDFKSKRISIKKLYEFFKQEQWLT